MICGDPDTGFQTTSDKAILLAANPTGKPGRFVAKKLVITAVMVIVFDMIPVGPPDEKHLPKPILPHWVMDRSVPETLENAGFASGSALALLHVVLNDPTINVPTDLVQSRLAVHAAVQGCKLEGRGVTEADVRDAYLLAAQSDAKGPNGDMLAFWRKGVCLGLHQAGWRNRLAAILPEEMNDDLPDWFEQIDYRVGTPVAKAAHVLMTVMQVFPRQEAAALLCAELVLTRALKWDCVMPLLSTKLSRKTIRSASDGDDILMACHVAVAHAAQNTIRLAHDLGRRAARLRAIEPKLRTKGASDAVQLFLSEDAILVSPMLTPTIQGSGMRMTPRSARRFCDRLVALGVARELTNRKTFRLYGVA